MKNALKVTFGTMLAVSMAAPIAAHALVKDPVNHIAVWGDLTYMRPSNNGLSIGDYALPPTPATFDGARNHYFIEPENEFDYAVGLSFRLPNYRHTRVFAHYDHFQNDVDRQGDTNIRNLGLEPNPPTQGISELDIVSHEFRIGAIHDLHFGDHFCLDLLAFFEWDKIRQELTETISQDPVQALRARRTENIASGWGPGIGFVSRWYSHNPHWHVFAGVNSSLIKMENDFTQTYAQIQPAAQVQYDYNPEDSDSIVGKLDIEFGLTYACAFRHEMQGMKWDISLGMRYMNMFNVFKNGNTAYQPFAFNNGAGAAEQVVPVYLGAAQDWGKYGPFLRFKIGGNHS